LNRIDDFHGQPAIHLQSPGGDRATVLLHGAHVVSWIPAGGSERLYLSPRSGYGDGQAIRGGVPVIFPQFNQRGPDFSLPKHGFVRNLRWSLDSAGDAPVRNGAAPATRPAQQASVRLRLTQDARTLALWPHQFSLSLTVSLEPRRLVVALQVDSPGDEPLAFTAALHTYLAIDDIARTTLNGLHGIRYLDTVTGTGSVASDDSLTFERETDRIYFEVPRPLTLTAPGVDLEVGMDGFRDTVVWNPWAELCAALPDMPDDGYRRMLCIEAAAIDKPVTLGKGESWSGRQVLTVR
jgi:glucose-6-phosphate 1-epimerase